MASTSAISGLVSGLDTKTIISQLMSIAKAPQNDLRTSLAKTSAQVTAAQSINSKAASMTSLAKELAAAKTYTTASASSSDKTVTAAAASTASSGSVTFQVQQVAQAYQHMTGVIASTTSEDDHVFSVFPPGVDSSVPANAIQLTADSANAVDIAAAINKYADASKPLNISATVVGSGDGQRLLLTSTVTGADNDFSTSGIVTAGAVDSLEDIQYGKDAEIVLTGSSGANLGSAAAKVTSASNTFKDLMPGVDVTVSAQTTTAVTVSTSVNRSAITSKVSSLVTAMNNVLSDVAFHTKALATGVAASATSGGLLRGNSTMRDLAGQVVSAVSAGTPGGDNATLAGLSVTRQGEVTFDAAAFDKLYTSDPAKAAAVLQKFADAVQTAGKLASDPTSGSVTGFINGSQTTVKTLTDGIATWDDRLAVKQKRLEAQYGALEIALGKLSSQSDSLTAALKQFNGNND